MSSKAKAYVNERGVWVCIDDLLKGLMGHDSPRVGPIVMKYLEKLRDKIINEHL